MKQPSSIAAVGISLILVVVTYFAAQHILKLDQPSDDPAAISADGADPGTDGQDGHPYGAVGVSDPSGAIGADDPSGTSGLSAPPPDSVRVSDPQARLFYEQGFEFYMRRQFSEAIEYLDQALAIDPQCYEALNVKGATRAFQGHHDQGIDLIYQDLDLNPYYAYAHFNLGIANKLAGYYDEAIAAFEKALELDPQDAWAYFGIASIYGRLGDTDKALDYLEKAIELEPDAKAVASNDADFASLRNDPRFIELVQP